MKVDINLSLIPLSSKIKVDGINMSRVRSVKIDASVETVPIVVLELIPDEINITGDALALNDAGLENYSDKELLEFVAKRCIEKVTPDGK